MTSKVLWTWPKFHSFPCQTLQNGMTGSADRGIEAKAWGKVKVVQLTKCPPQKSKRKKKIVRASIASGQLTHLEKHWRMETVSLHFRGLWACFFYIRSLPNVTHRAQVLIQTDILALCLFLASQMSTGDFKMETLHKKSLKSLLKLLHCRTFQVITVINLKTAPNTNTKCASCPARQA